MQQLLHQSKLMYNRLINFLEKNNILFEKQFGFRAHHSTEHAIFSIVNKIHQAIEEKSYSCGVFLDFSKAFDTVDHNILIRKLERYGIRGVANDWFISYLTNRKHYVSLNNTCSNLHNVTCGIPQGSVCSLLSAHIAQTVTNCFHYPTLGRQENTGGLALTNEN